MQPTDQIVSRVPEHIVANARPLGMGNGGRACDYNVAAWLQVPGMAQLPVTLLACYGDGERQHEVVIDHGTLNASGRILLSGIARLTYRYRIDNLQIRLRSAVGLSRLTVEELFVQAVEQIASDQRINAGQLS
ncbi:hypothetical protein DK254_23145 [Pseudomonas sp. RW407]|uniref:hypothetical protein n=1 Tax=Pseudomonas sp. RW407 TaxID=2202894 RepID=UPI000D704CBC|nr:hypothetical protein [Pseudomonas sp. RW407]PWU28705.1 hypothetical protein DK254_23145 [Pseudomonas sp. RW407]